MLSFLTRKQLSGRFASLVLMQARCPLSTLSTGMRSFPQYTVYGENCMLSLKVLLPSFKVIRNNLLVLENNKKGRILLEWTPRMADGKHHSQTFHRNPILVETYSNSFHPYILGTISSARESKIRFGLSPEEVGLIIDQLPDHDVELARRIGGYDMTTGSAAHDAPDKVLRLIPGNGGVVSFKVDFEKDGMGGMKNPGGDEGDTPVGPLEV